MAVGGLFCRFYTGREARDIVIVRDKGEFQLLSGLQLKQQIAGMGDAKSVERLASELEQSRVL
jgi:hypothetical protein